MSKVDPLDDHNRHLVGLPDHVLRDIARNEAASREYRKAAVERLVVLKSPHAKHPDLRELVQELEIELEGIQFEYPSSEGPGPLTCGVTTETMFGHTVYEVHEPPATLPEHCGDTLKLVQKDEEQDAPPTS